MQRRQALPVAVTVVAGSARHREVRVDRGSVLAMMAGQAAALGGVIGSELSAS